MTSPKPSVTQSHQNGPGVLTADILFLRRNVRFRLRKQGAPRKAVLRGQRYTLGSQQPKMPWSIGFGACSIVEVKPNGECRPRL